MTPATVRRGLDALMRPASIAVVGASDDPARIGGRPIEYLRRAGFAGQILPINRSRPSVQGLPAWPDIAALPRTPDLAIIAVAADAAVQAVEACTARGVPALAIFSSDFAESGAAGRARQDRIEALAAAAGSVILGPNCLGAYNAAHRMFATFSAMFEHELPTGGNVGIVSQSGGFGGHIAAVARERGVRVGQWLTTGNEAGVDVGQCLGWMIEQPEIAVALAYLEGVRDPAPLLAALARARELGKPVLFMKAGTSDTGAAAAQTHTAALAGADAVFDGMLRQMGAVRVPHAEAMVDAAYVLQQCPRPGGARVGIATISGAAGVQLADAADANGLTVPMLPEPAQEELRAANPFAAARNPVDITAQVFNDMRLVGQNLGVMLEHGAYDALVAYFGVTAASATMGPQLARVLSELPPRRPDMAMLLCLLAPRQIVRIFEQAGFAVFEEPARAMAALGRAARCVPLPGSPQQGSVAAAPETDGDGDEAALAAVLAHDDTEHSAKRVLAALGIPVPEGRIARSPEEAARRARELGGAVALKVHAPGLAHKSEVGGVALGLDAGSIADAAVRMTARIAVHPEVRAEGFLVERMAGRGVECFVGLRRDPQLGPVVAFGFGGVQAELFRDVATRLAPVSPAEVGAALDALRCAPLLAGYRGAPPADRAALVAAIVALAAFFAAHADAVAEFEINPLLVLPAGQGVLACDAVLERVGRLNPP